MRELRGFHLQGLRELEAATVSSAGSDSAIANDDVVEGEIIFGCCLRVGDGYDLGVVAADDDVSTDVEHDAGGSGAEGCVGCAGADVALGEGCEGEGNVAEAGGGLVLAI